jgi:hypothetical protein
MRLTVGPLPAAVYWRRRAAVALVIGLVIAAVAVTCSSRGDPRSSTVPGGAGTGTRPASVPAASATSTTAPTAPATTGSDAPVSPSGSTTDTTGAGGNGGNGGGPPAAPAPPPVVATVECTDAELLLTTAVSPSPAQYGGTVTLTLIVRNTADHPCFREVGSVAQELQVRQGDAVVWSSDSCGQPQFSDVRAFGPNIETQFWRTWNTYRVAPHECDTPPGATPAAAGSYAVVARLGTKVSEPMAFEIRV